MDTYWTIGVYYIGTNGGEDMGRASNKQDAIDTILMRFKHRTTSDVLSQCEKDLNDNGTCTIDNAKYEINQYKRNKCPTCSHISYTKE